MTKTHPYKIGEACSFACENLFDDREDMTCEIGRELYSLAKELWPFNRSITGEGVRSTLSVIKAILPNMQIREVPSGTKVFDWEIPKEWRVNDAWIVTPSGKRICEFSKNNLHLVGYSVPIRRKMPLNELNNHLYSLKDKPTAIPFVTSYYKERWGFCISEEERQQLEDGIYEVWIDAEHFEGSLTYGELFIPGELSKEILLSTYVCHPSMANNELSGPCVTTYLAKWLLGLEKRKYSYRIVFVPETIGSIAFLSNNIASLKKNVVAGFNVTCIGDDRDYSYLPSRKGNTVSDRVAKHVLKWVHPTYKAYKWSDRGSDERQYCAPNVDLPIASIMRTKYDSYPEYHTSLDDLVNVVTPEGLEGGYRALKLAIEAIERNCYPHVTVLGEPQLGKRGLYPSLSTESTIDQVQVMIDLISWSDGEHSLLEIAGLCDVPIWELYPILDRLVEHDLLRLE